MTNHICSPEGENASPKICCLCGLSCIILGQVP